MSSNGETQAPQAALQESLRSDMDALAARYEFSAGSTERLHGLVQLIDWTAPNFLPKSESAHDARERRRPLEAARHVVSSTLAESLSGLELEPVRAARHIGDIGSGAGFPGLVLAIALPQTRVTLIEKVREKCSFLRRAGEELGLDNVEVFQGSVQKWSGGAGACDVVTSRKVGRLNTMVEWSAPLLAPGGAVALWPGRSDFDEGADAGDTAADAAEAAGLRLAQVHPLPSVTRKGKRVVKHLYLYVMDLGGGSG